MIEYQKTPDVIVTIICDTNDGDYVESTFYLTKEEWELKKPLFEMISNLPSYYGSFDPEFLPGNYAKDWIVANIDKETLCNILNTQYDKLDPKTCTMEDLTETVEEFLHNYGPRAEHGWHTLESVTVITPYLD